MTHEKQGRTARKADARPEGAPSAKTGGLRDQLRSITLADVLDIRVLGLALTLAWQFVTFFSATIHFSTRNDVTHFNSVVGFSSLGMLAVFLLAALGAKAASRLSVARVARWVAPMAMAMCTIVLAIVDLGTIIRQPWCSVASTIAGAGLAVLYLAWGEVFSRLSGLQVTARAASSFLLAALLFAIIVIWPRLLAIAVTAILPLGVSVVLFGKLDVWGARTSAELSGDEASAVLAAEDERYTMRRDGAFSMRAVLSLGVLALAASLCRELLLDASPIISDGTYPWLFLIATLIAIVVVCGPLISVASLDFAGAYKASVYVLGFIFLLLPLVNRGSMGSNILGLATYGIMLLLVWTMLSRMTGLYHLSPLFAFGVGWASYTAGMLAGTFGGALLITYFDITPRMLSAVTLACVSLIFFAYLFLFTEKTVARFLGGPSALLRRPFRERCLEIAADYNLTPREEEIMELVAKGRSTPRIREELGLTAGTVNTHLNHLFKKLGVHDRQEIIDLIDAGRAGE